MSKLIAIEIKISLFLKTWAIDLRTFPRLAFGPFRVLFSTVRK